MKCNVSMLKDYLRCPQLAYNLHVLRRGDGKRSVALEVGTLFHEAMEQRLRGVASKAWTLPSFADVSDEGRAAWNKHKLWLPADAFILPPEWEVLAVEKALEGEELGTTVQGRLDALVLYNGKVWSLQWKTYDNDLLLLQERVEMSMHEVIYQWLADENALTPWGGTILGACQKLPGYRLVGGKRQEIGDKEREQALTFHYITRAEKMQKRMLWYTLAQMQAMNTEIGWKTPVPMRNFDQCFGPSGRGRCPYFNVCHEGGSLSDPQFIDIAPRY